MTDNVAIPQLENVAVIFGILLFALAAAWVVSLLVGD
jgi:hypothetical protein